jgi:hypothetical protein
MRTRRVWPKAAQGRVEVREPERREWRCPCLIRPLLGVYYETGGVHIKVAGRMRYPQHYVYDLSRSDAGVIAHCPACHQWRELYRDPRTGTIRDRAYTGYDPRITCSCRAGRPPQL